MIRKLTHEEIQGSKPSINQTKQKERTPLFVILDNIRSIYNVGAIFRTCDALLVEKIYLCGITGHPPRKDIDKVALGAVEVVPWEYVDNTVDIVRTLKGQGVQLCALELTHDSVHYKEANYPFPLAVILGNEVEGIGEDVMALVDMAVDIPMLGRANSLNVTTAFGIVGYEILSKYQQRISL